MEKSILLLFEMTPSNSPCSHTCQLKCLPWFKIAVSHKIHRQQEHWLNWGGSGSALDGVCCT